MAQKGTITLEKLYGGWGFIQDSSITTIPVEGNKDQYSNSGGAISLFRANRVGDISPGEASTAFTDASVFVNGLPLNGDVASAGTSFVVLDTARLVTFGIDASAIASSTDVAAHAGHNLTANSSNLDMLIYKDGSGDEWVISTWEDNIDADIMRTKVNMTSGVSAWFSGLTGGAVLTKGVPLKLKMGTDKIIYCTNGQYIASHDPSTSSGNAQALNLGAGWVAAALETYGNYLAIVGYKGTSYLTSFSKSECRLWLWDGFSPDPNFIFDLEDYYVTAVKKDDNGHLNIFTQGRDDKTKVKLFNGASIRTIFEYPSSLAGNTPKSGGVDLFRGMLHFGQGSGNFLISALMPLAGGRYGFHHVMNPAWTSAANLGMVRNLSTNLLFFGVKESTTYKITKLVLSSFYTNADLRTCLIKLPYSSTITKIKVYFSQFGSGASVLLSLFKDYTAISIGGADDLLNRTISNSAHGTITSFSIPCFIHRVNSFYINIRFNHSSLTNTAAIIRKIEIEYQPSNFV